MDEFTVAGLIKDHGNKDLDQKEEKHEKPLSNDNCALCGTMLLFTDEAVTLEGKRVCVNCELDFPSKIRSKEPEVRRTWYHAKPMPKVYICSYCGEVVEKIWIYSANSGIKRCKDCVVSGAKDDPDIIGR